MNNTSVWKESWAISGKRSKRRCS